MGNQKSRSCQQRLGKLIQQLNDVEASALFEEINYECLEPRHWKSLDFVRKYGERRHVATCLGQLSWSSFESLHMALHLILNEEPTERYRGLVRRVYEDESSVLRILRDEWPWEASLVLKFDFVRDWVYFFATTLHDKGAEDLVLWLLAQFGDWYTADVGNQLFKAGLLNPDVYANFLQTVGATTLILRGCLASCLRLWALSNEIDPQSCLDVDLYELSAESLLLLASKMLQIKRYIVQLHNPLLVYQAVKVSRTLVSTAKNRVRVLLRFRRSLNPYYASYVDRRPSRAIDAEVRLCFNEILLNDALSAQDLVYICDDLRESRALNRYRDLIAPFINQVSLAEIAELNMSDIGAFRWVVEKYWQQRKYTVIQYQLHDLLMPLLLSKNPCGPHDVLRRNSYIVHREQTPIERSIEKLIDDLMCDCTRVDQNNWKEDRFQVPPLRCLAAAALGEQSVAFGDLQMSIVSGRVRLSLEEFVSSHKPDSHVQKYWYVRGVYPDDFEESDGSSDEYYGGFDAGYSSESSD